MLDTRPGDEWGVVIHHIANRGGSARAVDRMDGVFVECDLEVSG